MATGQEHGTRHVVTKNIGHASDASHWDPPECAICSCLPDRPLRFFFFQTNLGRVFCPTSTVQSSHTSRLCRS